ncbi:MAG: DEAD/DEAH box helicase family protein [Leptospiraceae bacterium]|nr:DEAD/DEAH box helicase family protein [Leptospiraceae bacterium]
MYSVGNKVIVKSPKEFKAYGPALVLEVKEAEKRLRVFFESNQRQHFPSFDDVDLFQDPIDLLIQGKWEPSILFELKSKANYLLANNVGGMLSNSTADILPHQLFVASKATTTSGNFLIADEVGLGKTIEAGLTYTILKGQGKAKRTLIITPASLVMQWQREMKEKFNEDFAIYNQDFSVKKSKVNTFSNHHKVIASIDTLRTDNGADSHKQLLLQADDWDLVVFDEAHKLSKTAYSSKMESTERYKLAEDLVNKCKKMILLTATPHQGDESKFKNLLRLVSPDLLKDWGKENFKTEMNKFVVRNRKRDAISLEGQPLFLGRNVNHVNVELSAAETEFHHKLREYIKEAYKQSENLSGNRKNAVGFLLVTFQKIASSSLFAIRKSLEARLNLLNNPNISSKKNIDAEEFEGESEETLIQASEYLYSFKSEISYLETLIKYIDENIQKDSKIEVFIDLLKNTIFKENPDEKILIFTEYRQTQIHIENELKRRLGNPNIQLINGDVPIFEREKNVEIFKSEQGRFLISTEAGGEGINLQFCHIIINFDIPWNPMRIEQRIGRVHRYGQKKIVDAYNLFTGDSIEGMVTQTLEKKLNLICKQIGKDDELEKNSFKEGVLGELHEIVDFSKLYQKAVLDEQLFLWEESEIEARLKEAVNSYNNMQSYFDKLNRFDKTFYENLKSKVSLADLEKFIIRYLEFSKRKISKSAFGTYKFLTPERFKNDNLAKEYKDVTFDRKLSKSNPNLEFLGIGNPLTNRILEDCVSPEFGGFVSYIKFNRNESLLSETSGFLLNFIFECYDSYSELIKKEFVPIFLSFEFKEIQINFEPEYKDDNPRDFPSLNLDRFQFDSSLLQIMVLKKNKVIKNDSRIQYINESLLNLCLFDFV